MKLQLRTERNRTKKSPPSRGAWIEMIIAHHPARYAPPSPPSRGAWIEMAICDSTGNSQLSPPSRGAWIEIDLQRPRRYRQVVAPLAGGVD